MLTIQDVTIDPAARRAWRAGEEIRLARKEFDLLHAVISRAGEVVTREKLMNEVWETTFWTSCKTIDVHLGWLRRKLGDDPRNPSLITTLRGQGLRFELEDPQRTAAAVPAQRTAAAAAAATAAPALPPQRDAAPAMERDRVA